MKDTLAIIFVTVPNHDTAIKISRALLQAKLAACVNIIDSVQSLFLWEGKIDEAKESKLFIKTKLSLFSELEALVQSLHPYDTPEIVCIKTSAVTEKYLAWAMEVTK